MSKMESRVSYLESHLSANLDNLDAVSVQLTVIQDFLQKQFGTGLFQHLMILGVLLELIVIFNAGSRFVDYAVSRGVYIEKPQKSKSYYANAKTSSSLTSGSGSQGQGTPKELVQDIMSHFVCRCIPHKLIHFVAYRLRDFA